MKIVIVCVTMSGILFFYGFGSNAAHSAPGTDAGELVQSVDLLNHSVKEYMQNGGWIPAGASGETVLKKLKMKVSEDNGAAFPHSRGPFVDVRLRGLPFNAGTGSQRIVWDESGQQFRIASTGPGWSRLYEDERETQVDHGTESREVRRNTAGKNHWVWDYEETITAPRRLRVKKSGGP